MAGSQDPLGTLLQGILQGNQLGLQIKNQKLQEEAFQRRAILDQQEASVQDIMNRMKLGEAGRPIMGGTVTEQTPEFTLPGTDIGGGIKLPGTTVPSGNLLRKADPSRTVKYKGLSGTEEYELFTPDEQMRRQRERAQQAIVDEALAKRRATEDERRIYGVDIPDETTGPLGMPKGARARSQEELLGLTQKAAGIQKTRAETNRLGQPAQPTGERALLADYTRDFLESRGLPDTAGTRMQARAAYETEKRRAMLLPPEVEQQRVRIAQASRAPKEGPDPRLVQTVIANPALYDELTATEKAQLAPDLAKAGFTGFGKQLTQSAITKMSDSRSAIGSLRDLRQTLVDNEQYIGPLAGFQALYPYSEGRKAQADIDRVKQRVGKTLEGGVLRKEDEEKYKRILATLNDTPSTAIYKVEQMIEDLERDLDIYVEEQRKAGRKVNTGTPARPAATQQTTAPQAPAAGTVEDGYRFKGGDPSVASNWVKVK